MYFSLSDWSVKISASRPSNVPSVSAKSMTKFLQNGKKISQHCPFKEPSKSGAISSAV